MSTLLTLATECDHHHNDTSERGEVRRLPIGGGAQVFVCKRHYDAEMQFRRERIAAGAEFELPEWELLAVQS